MRAPPRKSTQAPQTRDATSTVTTNLAGHVEHVRCVGATLPPSIAQGVRKGDACLRPGGGGGGQGVGLNGVDGGDPSCS
jgi:hypothetical protein